MTTSTASSTNDTITSTMATNIPNNDNPSLSLADLRSTTFFPPFASLPSTNSIDTDYYHTVDGRTYRPTRHWCFLGEIVDIHYFLRLTLIVRDRNGERLPVVFYTGNGDDADARQGGQGRPPPMIQIGHTIAILYAHRRVVPDLTVPWGIRVHEMSSIKIIPTSLPNLLRLNDDVHAQSIRVNGQLECHGCQTRKDSLLKCGKCGFFWYCDTECQIIGWVIDDHKHDCKILRDKDIRVMLRMRWDDFQDYLKFPLQEETA